MRLKTRALAPGDLPLELAHDVVGARGLVDVAELLDEVRVGAVVLCEPRQLLAGGGVVGAFERLLDVCDLPVGHVEALSLPSLGGYPPAAGRHAALRARSLARDLR